MVFPLANELVEADNRRYAKVGGVKAGDAGRTPCSRRDFLKLTATFALALAAIRSRATQPANSTLASLAPASGSADRAIWVRLAGRLASPLLPTLAARRLKATMPIDARAEDRADCTHLEALGRLLCGLAPWLELGADATPEGVERARLAALARTGIDAATDPALPDFMNFSKGRQPLVDTAFFAPAMLRAPAELWKKLEPRVQANVIAALKSSRAIPAAENNWKLFATTVEVFLYRAGKKRDDTRLFEGLTKYRAWYLGDGLYGDGPEFHWDYYNSFVIHPMLVEALDAVGDDAPSGRHCAPKRGTPHPLGRDPGAAHLADGSFPAIGRSIAYRCGAFTRPRPCRLRHQLPADVAPAQARAALTSVIRRTLEAPGTFDANGWLRIGLSGPSPVSAKPLYPPAASTSAAPPSCPSACLPPIPSGAMLPRRPHGKESGPAKTSPPTTRSGARSEPGCRTKRSIEKILWQCGVGGQPVAAGFLCRATRVHQRLWPQTRRPVLGREAKAIQSSMYNYVPRKREQLKPLDVRWVSWCFVGNEDDGIFGEYAGKPPTPPTSISGRIARGAFSETPPITSVVT